MLSFSINDEVLEAIDDYHRKSLEMQKFHFEGNPMKYTKEDLKDAVDDDLIFHVPIYDMLDRRYAAFSSFLEALDKKESDPKGNGNHFIDAPGLSELSVYNKIALFYLFRLCGSGINYVPRSGKGPIGTHGFGNFWIVNSVLNGYTELDYWLDDLMLLEKPFTDNKGYLLPQFSFKHLSGGHLRHFIFQEIHKLVDYMFEYLVNGGRKTIIGFVEHMNSYLVGKGYKKQNFVLSATAADIAEYIPELIDPKSSIYAGTNAKKCIAAMFNKNRGVKQVKFETDAIDFLADRYDSVPYSVEDSRLCDVYRYLTEFQSKHHIELNGGNRYKNNSTIKKHCEYRLEDYGEYIREILKIK